LDINAPAIKILCQSVGHVLLKGKCENLTIKNQIQGDFNSKDLIADRLSIKNMAQGNVRQFGIGEIKHVDY